MSLRPPEKLPKLRAALHAKAKASPKQRFHALYDKVYRRDVLAHAYVCCKANGGAAGVDDQTFADLETYGRDRWLGELAETLRVKTYRPGPVRRVWIPKPDGRQVPGETFDFLGYTFGLHWTHRTKRKLLCGAPSKKRVVRVCQKISTITDRRRSGLAPAEVVAELNRVLRGWAGYFCLGPVSDTYRAINSHTRYRFRKWWGAKHKNARLGPCWYWSPWLERTYGLLQLRWDPSRRPLSNA